MTHTREIGFEVDDQTRTDLGVFNQSDDFSLYSFFDRTKTRGGKTALREILKNPTNNLVDLQKRLEFVRYLMNQEVELDLKPHEFDYIDSYFSNRSPVLHENIIDSSIYFIKNKISPDSDHFQLVTGISCTVNHLRYLDSLYKKLNQNDLPVQFLEIQSTFDRIRAHFLFKKLTDGKKVASISHLDNWFRGDTKEDLLAVLRHTYYLDAIVSIAKVANERKMSIPEIVDSKEPSLDCVSLFHPGLPRPITNDLKITRGQNVWLISGANMAGKSTFMKALGLSVYLAHVGLPVPAQRMRTSVFDSIYSAINLPDSIQLGYSHFFSEVNRVKQLLTKVRQKQRVFAILDELFKGTNIKDATDASLLVSKAFAKMKSSIFMISTHITEFAIELQKVEHVAFRCFGSHLEPDSKIEFDYKLAEGISSERLGLLILKREGIDRLIEEILKEVAT